MAEIPTVSLDIDKLAALRGIQELSVALNKLRGSVFGVDKKVDKLNANLGNAKGVGAKAKKAGEGVGFLAGRLGSLTTVSQLAIGPLSGVGARLGALSTLGKAAGVGIALTVTALVGVAVGLFKAAKQAIRFQAAMTEVAKNTGLAKLELRKLGRVVQGLAKGLGLAALDVAKIADQAGRLGIKGVKNIGNFTEVIAKLTITTNLMAASAATNLARLLNVTDESTDRIGVLGSVIVALGASLATSEAEIVKFAQEVARGGAIFGITSTEAAALGATLSAMGANAEASRTTIQKSFGAIFDALQEGGRNAKLLSTVLNQKLSRKHYALFLAAIHTGMRSAELAGLQWGDIDFNGKFLTVRRSWVNGRIHRTILPKNVVALFPSAEKLIYQLC